VSDWQAVSVGVAFVIGMAVGMVFPFLVEAMGVFLHG
jgi:hypothetical protein